MERRAPLGPGAKSLERGSTFASRGGGLKRSTSFKSRPSAPSRQAIPKRQAISPASPAQREKIRDAACLVCRNPGPCHPAHLIDRSIGGDDHPDAVVALCPTHHREYDEGDLSLLEYLEPHGRDELAHAVRLVGLISALQRITNQRWVPAGGDDEQTAPDVEWPS